MISCYIIDDEPHAIEVLAKYIQQTPGLQLTGTSTNPLEALQIFRDNGYPDISFIDVDMPQLSGLDLAELLQDKTSIAFVTAYDKYAIRAFEQNAVDYMLKPIQYERFLKCINRLNSNKARAGQEEKSGGRRDHFFIQYEMKGKIVKLDYDDVIFIEGMKNYVVIHTQTGQYITYITMKEMEENLPPTQFMRIHKSYIINLDKVVALDGNMVHLKQKHEIIVGVSYKDTFLQNLKDKMIRTKRLPGS
ncbi:MAG: response regulator transcription factor [Bacteroidetes bacterium]|nr:response regulator transcription factor [Bacteroidota bacterium]